MADDTRTVRKNFNRDLLREELTASALPFELRPDGDIEMELSGFVRRNQFEFNPSPNPRQISRDGKAGTVDLADPGELRFVFTAALTRPEGVVLDGLLAAHDATQRTAEQLRQEQDVTDLDALIADLPAVPAMTPVELRDYVEKLARVVIRDQSNAPV